MHHLQSIAALAAFGLSCVPVSAQVYTISELPPQPAGNYSHGYAISDSGISTGQAGFNTFGASRPAYWVDGGPVDLELPPPDGYPFYNYGWGAATDGFWIAGSVSLPGGDSRAFAWTGAGSQYLPMVALPAPQAQANSICNGHAVGFCFMWDDQGSAVAHIAVIWLHSPGGWVVHPLPIGEFGAASVAAATNTAGAVVGWRRLEAGPMRACRWPNWQAEAVDLGTLAGTASSARGMNSLGHCVGWAQTAAGESRAFLHDGNELHDLGVLPGFTHSSAQSINTSLAIVGWSYNGGATNPSGAADTRAFLWRAGTLRDLNDLIDDPSWTLQRAWGINSSGQVVGSGLKNGVLRGFVLTPSCAADFDGNGAVAVPDIFAFLSAWFAGQPAADFDDNFVIAVPDIFAFLSAWFAGCP